MHVGYLDSSLLLVVVSNYTTGTYWDGRWQGGGGIGQLLDGILPCLLGEAIRMGRKT